MLLGPDPARLRLVGEGFSCYLNPHHSASRGPPRHVLAESGSRFLPGGRCVGLGRQKNCLGFASCPPQPRSPTLEHSLPAAGQRLVQFQSAWNGIRSDHRRAHSGTSSHPFLWPLACDLKVPHPNTPSCMPQVAISIFFLTERAPHAARSYARAAANAVSAFAGSPCIRAHPTAAS